MQNLKSEFENAAKEVLNLKERPNAATLLKLYGCYKQATEGDITGVRPGILDFTGRQKCDAWAAVKGTSTDHAMKRYIALVEMLKR